MKDYFSNCVNWEGDVDELSNLIDNAEEIESQEFFRECNVEEQVVRLFTEYPDDFEFYKNGEIYFYSHSAIENFYK